MEELDGILALHMEQTSGLRKKLEDVYGDKVPEELIDAWFECVDKMVELYNKHYHFMHVLEEQEAEYASKRHS